MNESSFIKQNLDQWQELEELLERGDGSPQRLHDLFVKVSSDFAYARTYFPNRTVRVYLNQLTQRVFSKINKKKNKLSYSDITGFYRYTLPREILRNRWAFYVSLSVFILAVVIGVLSTRENPDFLRSILGDGYVEMTKDNINKGDPMAVYKKANQVDMFLGITVNNIRVAMTAFVMGLFASVGTVVIMIFNGVMLGAFQYFFYAEGLFLTSFMTIWIHGTIEISAIIVAGAAGLIIGQGALMPGTLRRSTSFRIKARQSLNILLSTLPLFVIAGFLEGFVTRMTEWPTFVKAMIILASASLILYIYVIYPWLHRHEIDMNAADLQDMIYDDESEVALIEPRSAADSFSAAIRYFKIHLGALTKYIILPVLISSILIYRLYMGYIGQLHGDGYYDLGGYMYHEQGGALFYAIYVLMFSYLQIGMGSLMAHGSWSGSGMMALLRRRWLPILLFAVVWVSGVYFVPRAWVYLYYLLLTPHFLVLGSYLTSQEIDRPLSELLSGAQRFAYRKWFKFLLPNIVVPLLGAFLFIGFSSPLGSFITDYILWHEFFGSYWVNSILLEHVVLLMIVVVAYVLLYMWTVMVYHAIQCQQESIDLHIRLDQLENVDS